MPWDFLSLTQFPPPSNLLTSLYTLYYFPTLMTSGAQSIIVLETLALYPETLYEHWFAYSTEQIEVPTVVLFALAWLLNFFLNVALSHQSTTDDPIQFFSSSSDC